jgi:uncharacterized protein
MASELEPATALTRLRAARRIAVLGASTRPARAGHYVPAYLQEQGYEILPVNPRYEGMRLFGGPVLGSLDAIEGPVDVVDVFRRSAELPDHLDELLRLGPGLVWLQLGIRHAEVTSRLIEAGIDVVQDRCTLADLRAAGGR